jgi:hypothetical protein
VDAISDSISSGLSGSDVYASWLALGVFHHCTYAAMILSVWCQISYICAGFVGGKYHQFIVKTTQNFIKINITFFIINMMYPF